MLEKVLIYIFFVFFTCSGIAQNNTECAQLLNQAETIYFSNPDSSYQLSLEAEKIAVTNNDKLSIAKANSYIGRYLLLKSELEEANIKFNSALAIYREIKNYKGVAYILKLKSILLKRIGNISESITMLEESIQMYREANDSVGIISSLLNISLDYSEAKEFNKAEIALNEVESYKELSTTNNYFLHQNKGILWQSKGDTELAISEFLISKKIAEENNMIDSYATILMQIGKAYCSKKEYLKAEEVLLQSKEVAIKNNLDNELIETYNELIILFEAENKFKEAYQTLKQVNELKNKILNIEKINRISSLEKRLAISEKEKEVQQAKSKTQKLVYILMAFSILLLLSLYMFFKTRNLKNRISIQNNKLEEKNNIIEEKSKGITDSIHYAKRIQQSLLPTDIYIDKSLKRLNIKNK